MRVNGNVRHEHEYKAWRDVKLPAGKILTPGVVKPWHRAPRGSGTVADRIITFAELVGRENVMAGAGCGLAGPHPSANRLGQAARPRDGAAIASKKLWS